MLRSNLGVMSRAWQPSASWKPRTSGTGIPVGKRTRKHSSRRGQDPERYESDHPSVASMLVFCECCGIWWQVTPGVVGSLRPFGMSQHTYEEIQRVTGWSS